MYSFFLFLNLDAATLFLSKNSFLFLSCSSFSSSVTLFEILLFSTSSFCAGAVVTAEFFLDMEFFLEALEVELVLDILLFLFRVLLLNWSLFSI